MAGKPHGDMSIQDLLHEAVAFHRAGNAAEAEAVYRRVLAAEPANYDALHLLGVLRVQLGDAEQAAQLFAEALAVKPGAVATRLHMAEVLSGLGRKADALQACDIALAQDADIAEAHLLRANIMWDTGRAEEAAAGFDRAIALKPDHALALFNRAQFLQAVGREDEALADCERALALKPDIAEAHHMRGVILQEKKRHEDALASFDNAVAYLPDLVQSHHGRTGALAALGRFDEALASSDRALALDPTNAFAHNNRAAVLRQMNRFEEALDGFNRAIALDPGLADAYFNRGGPLYKLGRLEEAYADSAKALALKPDYPDAASFHFNLAAHLCDWRCRAENAEDLKRFCRAGHEVEPFALLHAIDEPELHLLAAKRAAKPRQQVLSAKPSVARKRLRIAYLSADFRDHPVALLAVELFERHDRARFETYGIGLHAAPQSAFRERLQQAFVHFVEAGERTDYEIARMMAGFQIDIAIDLGGYTDKSRPQILSHRPAPVTATYLGYPGTLGADYIDYIIADANVIPPECDAFYTEKVVRLPSCFMPSDSKTRAAPIPSRRDAGLPEHGFVFCAFNKSNKLSPEMFDIWMRILCEVDDSVLWLNVDNHTARDNLRAEAEARHVSPHRLIFAERAPDRTQHLARLALTDLFLDTMPYNAHATASEFLRENVPVLTCMGRSFAARVAGSMLRTMGVEELIATDLVQYETLAVTLAHTPQRLADLRAKLATGHALFDMEGLTRHLEAAYETMWTRHLQGLAPESFSV